MTKPLSIPLIKISASEGVEVTVILPVFEATVTVTVSEPLSPLIGHFNSDSVDAILCVGMAEN